MARVYAALASTAIDPSQYDISNSGLYTKQIYNILNRKIGNTLYIKNMVFKDAALLKNPLKRRYEDLPNAQSMIGSPYIGERYNVYENLGRQIVFLDDVGGLSGFTYKNGFESTQNTSVQTNMKALIKENNWLFNRSEDDIYFQPAVSDNDKGKTALASIPLIKSGTDFTVLNRLMPRAIDESLNETRKPNQPLVEETDFYDINKSVDDIKLSRDVALSKYDGGDVITVNGRKKTYNWYEENGNISKDENHLEFDSISVISDPKGLLAKTNQLFSNNQINSMVNRVSYKNVSRGKNLTKNGNYLRVWTLGNQYTKLKQTIRPKDDSGNSLGLSDYQIDSLNISSYRPNNGASRLEDNGTMMRNGLPRIAPKKPEDVKKCMFSIENLAWKDINFSTKITDKEPGRDLLSEGQRGPNNGRIMWFPPYNLKFSENIAVGWEGSSFIGRGEQIYTYNNTERGGQLDFTILIDHPSAINKWSRYADENAEENEQRLLRFFIGEDNLKGYISNSKNETKKEEQIVSTDALPVKEPYVKTFWIFFPYGLSGKNWMEDTSTLLNYLYNGNTYSTNGYESDKTGVGNGLTAPISTQLQGKWEYEVDLSLTNIIPDVNDGNKDLESFGLNNTLKLQELLKDKDNVFLRESLHCQDMSDDEIVNSVMALDYLINGTLYNEIQSASSLYDVTINIKSYDNDNELISADRGSFINRWVRQQKMVDDDKITKERGEFAQTDEVDKYNSFIAKIGRSVSIEAVFTPKVIKPNISGINAVEEEYTQAATESNEENIGNIASITNNITDNENIEDEYNYFKELTEEDPIVIQNIVKKVKYFSPAFHSITPEGFNSRLTFLQQCTRQGPTIGDSNKAGNLAFGRPPVCVLKIGDFYNTKIIIESLSIQYESEGSIQWDLNQEGIGMQPMMANISIGFKFIGGSDLGGPIARLQNAVSENFFANTSVYSERADYKENKTTTKVFNITDSNAKHVDYEI